MKHFLKTVFLTIFAVAIGCTPVCLQAMKRSGSDLDGQPQEKRQAVQNIIPSLQSLAAKKIADTMKDTGNIPTFMFSSSKLSLVLQEEVSHHLLDVTDPKALINSIKMCNKIPTGMVVRMLKNCSEITPNKLRDVFCICCIDFIRDPKSLEEQSKNKIIENMIDMILGMTEDKLILITQPGSWGNLGHVAALQQMVLLNDLYLIEKFIKILGDQSLDAVCKNYCGNSLLHGILARCYLSGRDTWLLIIKTAGHRILELLCLKNYEQETVLMFAIKQASKCKKDMLKEQEEQRALQLKHPGSFVVCYGQREYNDLFIFINDLLEAAGDNALTFLQVRDDQGKTALDLAIAEECEEIISLLKEKLCVLCPQEELLCAICCDSNSDELYLHLPCCQKTICVGCGDQAILQGYQHVVDQHGNYGPEFHRCPFCRADISATDYQDMVSQSKK